MKQILLVDDDDAVRSCFREFLEHHGYHCTEAKNGQEALSYLEQRSFDLILTDHYMPVIDGISFLEIHRHTTPLPHVPTIMVSGHLTANVRLRAQSIRVEYIFEKPCEFQALLNAINSLIPAQSEESA